MWKTYFQFISVLTCSRLTSCKIHFKECKGNGISWENRISVFKQVIFSLSILNANGEKCG